MAKTWIQLSRIPLKISGGRDGGFRTYSHSSGLKPGFYRVRVETKDKRVIGEIRFDVLLPTGTTEFISLIK